MLKVLVYLFIGYIVLLAAVYLGQRRLLYLPDNNPSAATDLRASGLEFWPQGTNANSHQGLIATTDSSSNPHATVIIFHGNAGSAIYRRYYVQALAPLGYRVLLAQYPGYGGRPGQPSEAVLVAAARETIRLAHDTFGGPLIVWGESLGAGVTAAALADYPVPVAGAVLLTPWDNLAAVAQRHYWFLPARWLVRDRYNSIDNLRRFSGPVAVAVAGRDEIIPPSHGQRLYDNIPEPKELWTFNTAGHNSWPISPAAGWWREVMEFVTSR